MRALPVFPVPPRQAPEKSVRSLPGGTAPACVTSDARHRDVHNNKDEYKHAPAHASHHLPKCGPLPNNPAPRHSPLPDKEVSPPPLAPEPRHRSLPLWGQAPPRPPAQAEPRRLPGQVREGMEDRQKSRSVLRHEPTS